MMDITEFLEREREMWNLEREKRYGAFCRVTIKNKK